MQLHTFYLSAWQAAAILLPFPTAHQMKTGNNIRQRKDGRFEARYIKGRTEDGKIIYGYAYGATYEEAAAKKEALDPNKIQMRALNLLILGAGSHGTETGELAAGLRLFGKISFLDDDTSKPGVLGPVKDLAKYRDEYPLAFPAVGNAALRIRWTKELVKAGFIIPTFIHPDAVVSPGASIGNASIVLAGAIVGAGAQIGQGCIIQGGAAVGRNAKVPDWTWLDTGETIR